MKARYTLAAVAAVVTFALSFSARAMVTESGITSMVRAELTARDILNNPQSHTPQEYTRAFKSGNELDHLLTALADTEGKTYYDDHYKPLASRPDFEYFQHNNNVVMAAGIYNAAPGTDSDKAAILRNYLLTGNLPDEMSVDKPVAVQPLGASKVPHPDAATKKGVAQPGQTVDLTHSSAAKRDALAEKARDQEHAAHALRYGDTTPKVYNPSKLIIKPAAADKGANRAHPATVVDRTHDSSAKRNALAARQTPAAQPTATASDFATVEDVNGAIDEVNHAFADIDQRVQGTESRTATNSRRIDQNRQRIDHQQRQINDNQHEARSGIAAVAAFATVPEVRDNQTVFFGAGVSDFKGVQGMAIAASANAGPAKVKIGASYAGGDVVMAAGAGIGF